MYDTSTDMDVTGLDSNETISNLSSSFALTSPPSDLDLHIRDIETQLEQVSLERDDLRQERDVLAETKEDLLEIVQQTAEKNTKLQKELDSKTLEFERIRDKLETELGTAHDQLRILKEMHVIEKEALESSVLRKYLALEADFTHVQRAHLLDLRVKLGVIFQRMTQVEGTEILANELGAILTTMDEKIIPHPTPCVDDINIPQMSAAYWRQLFEEKDKEVTQLRHCVASLRREVEANESAFNERLATQDVAFGNCKWELRCTAAKLEDAEEELANLKAVGVGSQSCRTPASLSSESMEEGVYQTPGWVWLHASKEDVATLQRDIVGISLRNAQLEGNQLKLESETKHLNQLIHNIKELHAQEKKARDANAIWKQKFRAKETEAAEPRETARNLEFELHACRLTNEDKVASLNAALDAVKRDLDGATAKLEMAEKEVARLKAEKATPARTPKNVARRPGFLTPQQALSAASYIFVGERIDVTSRTKRTSKRSRGRLSLDSILTSPSTPVNEPIREESGAFEEIPAAAACNHCQTYQPRAKICRIL